MCLVCSVLLFRSLCACALVSRHLRAAPPLNPITPTGSEATNLTSGSCCRAARAVRRQSFIIRSPRAPTIALRQATLTQLQIIPFNFSLALALALTPHDPPTTTPSPGRRLISVFRQGDDAINWYALLEGSVDVCVAQSDVNVNVSAAAATDSGGDGTGNVAAGNSSAANTAATAATQMVSSDNTNRLLEH